MTEMHNYFDRRNFLKTSSVLGLSCFLPFKLSAQDKLPERTIPGTKETLPIIGLGSSKPVMQIPEKGTEPLQQIIKILVDSGGRVVDTSPRIEAIDSAFGKVLNNPVWRDQLFVSTKINTDGKQAGIDQMHQTQRLFDKHPTDLILIESMRDLHTHWPSLLEWKENGEARYIGITVSRISDHDRFEDFMEKEPLDFVQLNYSVAEPQAEERLLPIAQDRGIAVLVNRPFMNGNYFGRVAGKQLPPWASEIDCASWAQFSLKYIISHPTVTCVLAETTNPKHMEDNLQAAFGRLPDASMKTRMRELIKNL